MTWKEFKYKLELAGVEDDSKVNFIWPPSTGELIPVLRLDDILIRRHLDENEFDIGRKRA